MLQLRKSRTLVTCGYDSITGVSFWNPNTYVHLHTIKGYGVSCSNRMIELCNGNIALFSRYKPYPIVVIRSYNDRTVKEIKLKDYIIYNTSLYRNTPTTFMYVYSGNNNSAFD